MSITQKEADIIVSNIKKELNDKFGDVININMDKTKILSEYCKKRMNDYDKNKDVIHHAYWYGLYDKYKTGYEKAVEAVKKRREKNKDDLFEIFFK